MLDHGAEAVSFETIVASGPNSAIPHHSPTDRAIEAGDSHGGCSVHLVTAELDDGPILGQTPVAILPSDTADSLAARVLIAEHQLYSRVLA